MQTVSCLVGDLHTVAFVMLPFPLSAVMALGSKMVLFININFNINSTDHRRERVAGVFNIRGRIASSCRDFMASRR